MNKKITTLLLTCFAYVLSVCAQNISVSAPTHVATGENFRVSYTIANVSVDEFRSASIPSGLEVIAGPYTSQQSSYQIVNGHTSRSSSITYTYTLYAEKAGSYTIGAAHAKAGGHSAYRCRAPHATTVRRRQICTMTQFRLRTVRVAEYLRKTSS